MPKNVQKHTHKLFALLDKHINQSYAICNEFQTGQIFLEKSVVLSNITFMTCTFYINHTTHKK